MSEQIFDPTELSRKNNLLPEPHEPLSIHGQLAIRCAECILSRLTNGSAEAPPGVIIPYIPPCTGQSSGAVNSTFRILMQAGMVSKQPLPGDLLAAQLYGSSNPPLLYKPTAAGQQFFRPQRRPGCKRTEQHSIVDSLPRYPRLILQRAARFTATGEPLTRNTLGHNIIPATLRHALQLFVDKNVLGQNEDEYQLTERGLWLAQGLPPAKPKSPPVKLRFPSASPKTSPAQPKPETSPAPVSPDANEWMRKQVEKLCHPRELRTATRALQQLITDQVLEITDLDESNGQRKRKEPGIYDFVAQKQLRFSERAIAHTSPAQRGAIAVWQKVDRLLYQRNLDVRYLLYELRLRTDTSIDEYAQKVIYRKLMAQLTAQQ